MNVCCVHSDCRRVHRIPPGKNADQMRLAVRHQRRADPAVTHSLARTCIMVLGGIITGCGLRMISAVSRLIAALVYRGQRHAAINPWPRH